MALFVVPCMYELVSKKKLRKVVALILVLDFGMLAVLKYFSVYLTDIASLIGVHFELGFLIPLGISSFLKKPQSMSCAPWARFSYLKEWPS